MQEQNVDSAVVHPGVMIASDGVPFVNGTGHPRGAGTYARILGHYVRERGMLSLADAIAKMTILPARRLESFVPAMRRKGRVAVGSDADLTIFDPALVADRSTYDAPARPSIGISHVLVNGSFVVRDGKLVEAARPGRGVTTLPKR
jgi:dihydroorotase